MNNYWETDAATYELLQKLKQFISFVSNLRYTTKADKQKAKIIERLITTINKPITFKNWNVCLDIFDRDIQYGIDKQGGTYWRSWSVWFEKDYLKIEAKTRHTEEPVYHYGDDFYYSAYISFKPDLIGDRLYIQEDIKAFVSDALQYENYITDSLNDIEIDIDVEN